jgi:hypothetical protein
MTQTAASASAKRQQYKRKNGGMKPRNACLHAYCIGTLQARRRLL